MSKRIKKIYSIIFLGNWKSVMRTTNINYKIKVNKHLNKTNKRTFTLV